MKLLILFCLILSSCTADQIPQAIKDAQAAANAASDARLAKVTNNLKVALDNVLKEHPELAEKEVASSPTPLVEEPEQTPTPQFDRAPAYDLDARADQLAAEFRCMREVEQYPTGDAAVKIGTKDGECMYKIYGRGASDDLYVNLAGFIRFSQALNKEPK